MGRTTVVSRLGRHLSREIITLWALPALLCIALLLSTCGSSNTTPDPSSESNIQAPSIAELTEMLTAELEKLGKDVNKTTSAAPSGSDNAVFDLSAEIIGSREASAYDPGSGRAPYRPAYVTGNQDGLVQGAAPTPTSSTSAPTQMGGTGGSPVFIKSPSAITGITLTWTELVIGDYDQNGEVNLSDLAPLAINWGMNVAYDNPAMHGGFGGWPTGDPDGAGALNWRMARVDGDSNSEINTADIAPIAVHFKERIDGYRVYRKAPGEAQFTMLPPPVPVAENVTLEHPDNPSNTAPVRYSLSDSDATPGGLGDGVYQYYVASYDKTSGADGPASGVVHVDIESGIVNQSPVAQLSITPDFTGAPAEITLDASASYDPDGTVAAYEWDFDADGVVDWLSTDPVPEESSSGTVDSISEVSPGIVTVTFNQGSDDYYYPTVVPIDDEGAESVPGSAQLGLTGWKYMQISGPDIGDPIDFELPWGVGGSIVDPATGEFIFVGGDTGGAYSDDTQNALYIARADRDGIHSSEMIVKMDDERFLADVPGAFFYVSGTYLAWDENGRLMIFLDVTRALSTTIPYFFLLRQQADGEWSIEPLDLEYQDKPYRVIGLQSSAYFKPGEITFRGSMQNVDDSDDGYMVLLHYRHGEWIIEDAEVAGFGVWDALFFGMLGDESLVCDYYQAQEGIYWGRQLGYEDWITERVDDDQFALPGSLTYMTHFMSDTHGNPWFFLRRFEFTADFHDEELNNPLIVVRKDNELTGFPLGEMVGDFIDGKIIVGNGLQGAFVGITKSPEGVIGEKWLFFYEVQGNGTFSDEIIHVVRAAENNTGTVGYYYPTINSRNEIVLILQRNWLTETSRKVQVLCSRFDPRI